MAPFGLCLALCLAVVEWFAFHPVFMGEEHLLTGAQRETVLDMTRELVAFTGVGVTIQRASEEHLEWDIHCFPGDTIRVEWIRGDGWSHRRLYS